MTFETLFPILAAPLITAIIGVVFSKFGIENKTKELEFKLKKVELLEKLKNYLNSEEEKKEIVEKINRITNDLVISELKDDDFVKFSYKEKPWYYRLIFLPRLKSTAAKITGYTYYIYLTYGLIQLYWIPDIIYGKDDRKEIAGLLLILSFILAFVHRKAAIHFSHRDAIVKKAKIEIHNKSKTNNNE
ncbi:hypothetical protein UJ101_00675 [Flavobacteriaceae bacterium UJ101]|nr:hypothetical protein UJ101_00675 [Flavobacteriaceae bacterium UJ101]